MSRYVLMMWWESPWGTLAVNLIGCLVMGFALGFFDGRVALTAPLRTMVFAGFLGSFTTYSAFALETETLLHTQPQAALLNIGLHLAAGLLLVYGGMQLGRAV